MAYIDVARKYANKSRMGYKLAAIVVKGGNIRGVGFNHYSKSAFPKSIHAEIAAIQDAGDGVNNSTLWIFRFCRNGNLGLAKSCKSCVNQLSEAGVKEIVYSTDTGFERMKIGGPK